MNSGDIILSTLQFLEPEEILKTCSVNKEFKQVCESEYIWKNLYTKKYIDKNINTLDINEYKNNYKKAFKEETKRSKIRKMAMSKFTVVTQYAMLYLYSLSIEQAEKVIKDTFASNYINVLSLSGFKYRDFVISSVLKGNSKLHNEVKDIVKNLGKEEDNYTYLNIYKYLSSNLYVYANDIDIHPNKTSFDNIDMIYMILNEANKTSPDRHIYTYLKTKEEIINKFFMIIKKHK